MARVYYLLPAIAAPLAGYLAAHAVISWLILAKVCTVFAFIGAATWAGNDFLDRHLDARGTKKTLLGLYVSGGTGLATQSSFAFPAFILFMVLAELLALGLAWTISVTFFAFVSVCAIVGFLYSMPRGALKGKGLLGASLVAVTYGILAFGAGRSAAGGVFFESGFLLFGCLMSCLILGFDGIAHLIDYHDDKMNHVKTIAVQFGIKRTKQLLVVLQLVPILAFLVLANFGFFKLHLLITCVVAIASLVSAGVLFLGRDERHMSVLRVVSVLIVSSTFFILR